MLRVGQIPYLNCEPFFNGLPTAGIQLCPMPPSSMGLLGQTGDLDAAPFSLVQSFALEDSFEVLGDMGISVKGPVQSILFFSKVPAEGLSGALVGVTTESATAVQLMKVFLEIRHGVLPKGYVGPEAEDLDALLLIGDEALETHDHLEGFPYRYDLAEEWLLWKGLPFVFARWMVRRSLEQGAKDMLSNRLRTNLDANMAGDLEHIVRRREHMGMPAGQVVDYLRAFRYVLSEEDWRAAEVFREEWGSLATVQEAAR